MNIGLRREAKRSEASPKRRTGFNNDLGPLEYSYGAEIDPDIAKILLEHSKTVMEPIGSEARFSRRQLILPLYSCVKRGRDDIVRLDLDRGGSIDRVFGGQEAIYTQENSTCRS